jgi:hypothetical protein
MGACERCWVDAFTESRRLGGSQVDHYRRLLIENEGKPGHPLTVCDPPYHRLDCHGSNCDGVVR